MSSRVAVVAAFLAGLGAAATAFAQHEGHQMPATPGGMGACAEHSRASLEIIDRAQRRLEESRQTNSPSRMRAAVDDLQQALGELRTHQSLCISAAGAEAKSSESPKPGSLSGVEMMDHAKMPEMQGMEQSNMPGTKAMDQSKKAGKQDMDHSKMPGMAGMVPSGTAATGPKKSMPGMAPPQAETKDPICFKDGDTKGAEKATYKGKTYYFCSRADRERFLSDPAPYVNR